MEAKTPVRALIVGLKFDGGPAASYVSDRSLRKSRSAKMPPVFVVYQPGQAW